MSILSGPVTRVSNTQIAVGFVYEATMVERRDTKAHRIRKFKVPSNSSKLQLTIMSTYVEKERSREPVVMIVPFPMKQQTRRFAILNIDQYEDVFADLNKFFKGSRLTQKYTGVSWRTWDDAEDVDNFHLDKYEDVKAIGSFASLQKQRHALSISENVIKELEQYYRVGYGFIVCTLGSSAKYYPLAFVHEPLPDGRLFVPTRQIHGHVSIREAAGVPTMNVFDEVEDDELNAYNKSVLMMEDKYIRHKIKRSIISSHNIHADMGWDHEIFIINHPDEFALQSNPLWKHSQMTMQSGKPEMIDNYKKYIKIARLPVAITFNGITNIHRVNVHDGYQNNHDLII